MNWSGTARWSCHHKSSLVIVDTAGAVLATFEVSPNATVPALKCSGPPDGAGIPVRSGRRSPR